MRKNIIAANWKMNTLPKEGVEIANKINQYLADKELPVNKKIVLGVPFTHLIKVVDTVDYTKIAVAAQNCSQFESGAYTGEVSAAMIKSCGAQYVIIGHSERRQYFYDTDEVISQKLSQAYKNALFPIFCCGETLKQREENIHFKVVENQLVNAFIRVDKFNFERTIIAYEPVWAIGTGLTATPEQAQEMHMFIRNVIAKIYGHEVADQTSILYGGSVNATNAKSLFECEDIDGGLVGGASLKPVEFIKIIESI